MRYTTSQGSECAVFHNSVNRGMMQQFLIYENIGYFEETSCGDHHYSS